MNITIDQARLRRLLTTVEANHHARGWDEPPAVYLIYDAALDREQDAMYRSTFGLCGTATEVVGYTAQPFLPNLGGQPAHQVFRMAKRLEAAQSPFDNSIMASASRAFIGLAHSPALFAVAMCTEAWAVEQAPEDAAARVATGRRTIADHPNAKEIRDVWSVDLTGRATRVTRTRGKPVKVEFGPLTYEDVIAMALSDQPTDPRPEDEMPLVGGIVAQSLGVILAALARRPVPKLDGTPLTYPGP